MPLATHDAESSGGFEQAVSLAGKIQIVNINMPNGNPTVGQTIATSGSWTSGLIFSDGYQILTVGVKMDRAGTLLITRYIDLAGQMARPVSKHFDRGQHPVDCRHHRQSSFRDLPDRD
jgi:hypothetical protein